MNEVVYRLMNHDSNHTAPVFHSYTIAEHNQCFGTNYQTAKEAIDADPEYLFDDEGKTDYVSDWFVGMQQQG